MAKMLNFEVFKKRPVLTTGIVLVGGLLVYIFFFHSPSNPQSPEQVGYTDANVNASSALAAAQMQAGMQAQQIQGQLAALQIQGANALNLAQVDANTQESLAAFAYKAAQLDHARDMYGLELQSQTQMYGIKTSAEVAELQISSQLEALHVQAERDIAQQKIMTEGNLALGAQAAAVSMAGIQSQENIAHYSMDTTLGLQQLVSQQAIAQSAYAAAQQQAVTDAQVQLAQINANAQVQQAQIAANTSKANTKQAASASKHNSTASTIGTIAVAALALFCDRAIKSIDKCVSNEACLNAVNEMPIEFWHYIEGSEPHDNGDTAQHLNTYAQDFYRTLGADDWSERKKIAIVDYMGALTGAIKSLAKNKADYV